MKKHLWQLVLVLVIASLAISACGTAATPTAATGGSGAPATGKGSEQGQELADAFAGKLKGKVVTMAGPFTDNDAVKFDESVKSFEEATGIDIQYEGSKEFEATIAIRIEGGDAPDIADFPQPGLLNTVVQTGKVIDLTNVINQDWLKKNYNQSWLDMSMMTQGRVRQSRIQGSDHMGRDYGPHPANRR